MLTITIISVIVAITSVVALIINNRRQNNAELAQRLIEDIADSFDKQLDKFD